jgi:hypothetical protein
MCKKRGVCGETSQGDHRFVSPEAVRFFVAGGKSPGCRVGVELDPGGWRGGGRRRRRLLWTQQRPRAEMSVL